MKHAILYCVSEERRAQRERRGVLGGFSVFCLLIAYPVSQGLERRGYL